MSHCENRVESPVVATAEARQEFAEKMLPILESRFGAVRDAEDSWGFTILVDAPQLRNVVLFLRDTEDCRVNMLLDVVGVDYLGFKDYTGPRFAVEYVLKSVYHPSRRVRIKVRVSETDCKVPTISDLFPIAHWQEREVWDQYGIVFENHPDLRRLLNHAEFQGHPLRKDYPAHKRQWLSTNDFLLPELEQRLEAKGYRIISRSKEVVPNAEEYLTGSIKQ